MLIGGQKWACQSCIKGHRVSNCNHTDRELFPIAPKGRPVKQCEHCRSARKDKSHHAKCDCGNKKKESAKSEPKSEEVSGSCCCHKGSKCSCSSKGETLDLRLQTSLARPTHAVKSKAPLSTSISEPKLTVFANGHHKPVHRNNNLAHTSGAPYKIPRQRPHTLHGAAAFGHGVPTRDVDAFPRSVDDLMLGANNGKLYGSPTTATHGSVDSLLAMPTATYDFELLSTEPTSYFDATQMVSAAEPVSQSMGYFDSSLAAVAEDGDFTTLEGWSIPSATTDFFLPADLPLSAATYTSDYAQPLSHSGESAYLSAPGLTAPSSGSQSEVGDHGLVLEADIASAHTDEPITGFWKDTVQFRDSYRVNSGAEYAYNGDVKGEMGLAGYVEAMAAARHASDATVVPTTSATPLEQVNVGHMQNLAALKGSRLAAATGGLMGASSVSLSSLESSSAGSTPVDGEWGPGAGEPEGILIPAGIEDAPRHEDWLYSGREMRGQDYFWLS